MTDSIRYHPKSYILSNEAKAFFAEVTADIDLQKCLYNTEKIDHVALIARELGYGVKGYEILKAQAGRVLAMLQEQPEDVKRLFAGEKADTGAQWGRGGNGYLDNAGYWLKRLSTTQVEAKMAKEVGRFVAELDDDALLMEANSLNAAAELMREYGFSINAADLLEHQAQAILALSDESAQAMAVY